LKLHLLLFVALFSSSAAAYSQYFFTGEVRDVHGDRLPNVAVLVQSTGTLYKTGLEGNFEISSRSSEDSLLFAMPGYEPFRTAIRSADFVQITLKMRVLAPSRKGRLLSASSGASVSFPADIDGMSYSMIRRFLDMGRPVPAEAVKVEELLNYFNLYYEEPEGSALFHCTSGLMSCPWNGSHRLLYLNTCARISDRQGAPPANLVYLIDASGSMDMPRKLSLVRSGFPLLIKNLRDNDKVSVVVFGSRVGVAAAGVSGANKGQLLSIIEGLRPDGPSPGLEGLKLAYQVAQQQMIQGGNNKVVLITDGDISNGGSSRQELGEMIDQQAQAGIRLSCLGVGVDSVRNSELPWMAATGHGNFAAIEETEDAERVLLNELGPNFCTVADSVCITAGFDTSLVKEYRLIGFERTASMDSAARLLGGKVASGHSLVALFELVPKKDSADIKYIADISIGYCLPGKKGALKMDYNCPNQLTTFERASVEQRKAACIALFGMKLKDAGYASGISWADIEKMAKKNFSVNNVLDRNYLSLVAEARRVYEHTK